MKKLLAIGNSFSEDATYYLHQILDAAGEENKIVNLYIGGCPLERHWENIEKNAKEYQYQENGVITDRYVSIEEVLLEDDWDYIVTQQASHDSGWEVSYEPFLGLLVQYLKEKAPKAKICLQETWAYEPDSTHDRFMRYSRNQQLMYEQLKYCYEKAAAAHDLQLIPCGDLIQKLRKTPFFDRTEGSLCISRDGFHMGYLYGRYALAGMWAKTLWGINMVKNSFVPYTEYLPDEKAKEEIVECIREKIDFLS